MKRKIIAVLLSAVTVAGLLAGCGESKEKEGGAEGEETIELTALMDATDASDPGFAAVLELAEEKLGIKVNVESMAGGTEADNLVKTRLASGDMSDLLIYNSGALLSALNPKEYFIDISGESFSDKIDDSYKDVVGEEDTVYGVPFKPSQAYAILYNKSMYEQYNLEVPKTWDEFIENCAILKENGETAILGSAADSWTCQIPFLGDAYNLETEAPDFAEKFDAGEAKWATTPEGLRGFEKLEDTIPYYNEDYLATTYDDGCDMMANGKAAHWIVQTKVLGVINDLYDIDVVNNIRVFPIPSDDAEVNGLTLAYPKAVYGNKNSEKEEAILEFMEFYISDEALDAYFGANSPIGPVCIKDYEIPGDGYDAITEDIQPYVDEGKTAPALEYISPVKGADCASICQELVSGQITAEEAAEKYDKDCEKQATQLGLDW